MEKSVLTFTVVLCDKDSKVLRDVLESVTEFSGIAINVLQPVSKLVFDQYQGLRTNVRWMLKPDERGAIIVNLYELKKLYEMLAEIKAQIMVGKSDWHANLWHMLDQCYNSVFELFDNLLNPLNAE